MFRDSGALNNSTGQSAELVTPETSKPRREAPRGRRMIATNAAIAFAEHFGQEAGGRSCWETQTLGFGA